MEEKKVTIRVDPETHKLVRRKMEDEFGRDNFQALLVGYLARYLAGEQGNIDNPAKSRSKTVFDDLLEVDPESAEELVPLMESRIKKAIARKNAAPISTIPEKATGARIESRAKKRA